MNESIHRFIIEKDTSSLSDFFDKLNISKERRTVLQTRDFFFLPVFYRDTKYPCFTEGTDRNFKLLKEVQHQENIDLCMNFDDEYHEYQMHSSCIMLGTIVSTIALNIISNILYDFIKNQYHLEAEDKINVTIINPTENCRIDINGSLNDIKNIPQNYSTYEKSGKLKCSFNEKGNMLDVIA